MNSSGKSRLYEDISRRLKEQAAEQDVNLTLPGIKGAHEKGGVEGEVGQRVN